MLKEQIHLIPYYLRSLKVKITQTLNSETGGLHTYIRRSSLNFKYVLWYIHKCKDLLVIQGSIYGAYTHIPNSWIKETSN